MPRLIFQNGVHIDAWTADLNQLKTFLIRDLVTLTLKVTVAKSLQGSMDKF